MSVLKDILSESQGYYLDIKKKIENKLAVLPKGSIKERKISGRKYYYLQHRAGDKVVHQYLGKKRPERLLNRLKERRLLKAQLKKAQEALKVLKKAIGDKND
jgi:hypothetical protein